MLYGTTSVAIAVLSITMHNQVTRFSHSGYFVPCYGCLADNLRPSSKRGPEHFPSFSRRSACRCIRNCCTSLISNGSGAPGRRPALRVIWWPRAGPNHRHADFQSAARKANALASISSTVLKSTLAPLAMSSVDVNSFGE